MSDVVTDVAVVTPIERHGNVWVKRDDLLDINGARGGKVRTCWALAQGAPGLVTAGSRSSPQCYIVAKVAKLLGVPCRVHCPTGELGPEVQGAKDAGAEVVQHKAGYNNVIVARARQDAAERGWREIPFGMECREAVEMTWSQVQADAMPQAKRIVMPVGSGMSLAGVLWGLRYAKLAIPVVGVVVGAAPTRRLDTYAPPGWRDMVMLVLSGSDYDEPAERTTLEGGLELDPHYEAKCLPFLRDDDLLWVVGIRPSITAGAHRPKAKTKGKERRLTFVAGTRDEATLDDTSKRRILDVGSGTSIFDPVLCEVAMRWFSPPGGVVLDPFAGGSVRGIVASKLGRPYVGIELRHDQVVANREQWDEIGPKLGTVLPTLGAAAGGAPPSPRWIEGDSVHLEEFAPVDADMVFTCPPYASLEVYSNDPRDISNMEYPSFLEAYRKIIAAACRRLKQDRFAVIVVGEVRGPTGAYLGFVPDTVRAFTDAGLAYYDELALVTAVGSLPLRAGKQMQATRKVGKGHQNVLVFVKGDPKRAATACGTIDLTEPPEAAGDAEAEAAADA